MPTSTHSQAQQTTLKLAVAQAACDYVAAHLPADGVLGVGTGSTANCFIDALAARKIPLAAAIASSEATRHRLEGYGIAVLDLNALIASGQKLSIYVDGADEIDGGFNMIKGGGGALTREKIVAAAAATFVCICDASKCVQTLGRFPLPIEIIPMACAYVTRTLRDLGGTPQLRADFITDNGNQILDVHGLTINDPCALETRLNQIPGVVTNGLFAQRGADILLLGTPDGVRMEHASHAI